MKNDRMNELHDGADANRVSDDTAADRIRALVRVGGACGGVKLFTLMTFLRPARAASPAAFSNMPDAYPNWAPSRCGRRMDKPCFRWQQDHSLPMILTPSPRFFLTTN
ncbi:hypothetical protein [Hoeflea alexandrii]